MNEETTPPETQTNADSEVWPDIHLSDLLDKFLSELRGNIEDSLESNLTHIRTESDAIYQMAIAVVKYARTVQNQAPFLKLNVDSTFWKRVLDQMPVASPLSESLATIDSREGRQRVTDHLEQQPFPHYESVADSPELLVRIESDGTRTVGRFVDRQFKADG